MHDFERDGIVQWDLVTGKTSLTSFADKRAPVTIVIEIASSGQDVFVYTSRWSNSETETISAGANMFIPRDGV